MFVAPICSVSPKASRSFRTAGSTVHRIIRVPRPSSSLRPGAGCQPRVVEVAHRSGIEHEPPERRIGALDEVHDLLVKRAALGVEQLRAERIDEEARRGLHRLVDQPQRARAIGRERE